MSDTKKKSLTEQVIQMLVGYFMGVGLNYLVLPWFGVSYQNGEMWIISLIFTVISYFRGYAVRRWFNRLPPNWTFKNLISKV